MNNNYTKSELLVQYLDGELSPDEKGQLEVELKTNADLQEELQNLALAKNTVKIFGIKQKVGNIHREMMSEMATTGNNSKTGIVRKMARSNMRIVASILIILVGLATYKYVNISPDNLFAENYQPFSLSVNRGTAEITAMEKAYQQKNYKEVIDRFVGSTVTDQKENFLAGQASLINKDYKKAIEYFKHVLALNASANETIFKEDAEYYLGLSYLKTNELKSARSMFETIHNNSGHLYNDKVNDGFMRQLKWVDWKY